MKLFGDFYRPHSRGDNVCVSVRPFVCGRSPVWTVRPWFLAWRSTLTLASLGFYVKVVDQRSRSNSENCLRSSMVQSRTILWLGLPSSASGNCEWPLPVHWNCLFVSNQGAFNVSCISGRSALIRGWHKCFHTVDWQEGRLSVKNPQIMPQVSVGRPSLGRE